MRILVVDDEPDIRVTTAAMLEHLGHEVRTARNGAEALESAEQWWPDVVMMDLTMPVMNGFVAIRRLRANAAGRPTHVIACSAHVSDPATRQLAAAAGCHDFMSKPMDWKRVEEILAALGK